TDTPTADETTPAAEPTDDATDEAPPAAEGSLTMWTDETRIAAFQQLGEAFAAETGVEIDVVQKPTDDVRPDFISQAPTGQGPDMIVGAHDWLGGLVQNGVIAPIDLANADDFNPSAVQAFTYEGNIYGLPYALENIALVRNNELLQDTPATFDELIAQSEGLDVDFPIVIQQGPDGDAFHLYPLQMSFGAPVFETDENGDYTTELGMEGENGTRFAEYIQQLGQDGVLSGDIGGDQAKQAFMDGNTPYMITGPWWTTEFVEAGMDISVLQVPSAGGETAAPFVGVQGVFVSSYSDNALLANQFIEFLGSKESQDVLYEMGGRAPALAASADEIDDELLKGFDEASEGAQPMPAIPEMDAVWSHWGGTQVAIINGTSEDAAAAWQTMNDNIKANF
ncbi:MAG: extracellular solute-binding protein, partial [Propionibacterium sp.]|nr:extracellular solute-binding protein [Propionibacterium sp.]